MNKRLAQWEKEARDIFMLNALCHSHDIESDLHYRIKFLIDIYRVMKFANEAALKASDLESTRSILLEANTRVEEILRGEK